MKSTQLKNMDELCQVFKTIGNRNRLKILLQLATGELSVSEIEFSLEIKQPNLSHELKKLRDLGLVSTRRDSKLIYYRLANDQVVNLINGLAWLTSMNPVDGVIEIKTILPSDEDVSLKFASVSESSLTELAIPRSGECGDFPVIRH